MTKTITATTERSRLDIVQGILDLIAARDLEVNSMTSENELARKLELNGRSPVLREALALLTRDGIVQPYPQRGYLIREISTHEAKEIVRLRAASQKLVVEKLATLELGSRLNQADEHQRSLSESADSDDCPTFLTFEGRLCRELARLSSLFTATQVVGAWSDQLRVFYVPFPLEHNEMQEIGESYLTLLERIKQHDGDGAIVTIEAELQDRIQGIAKRDSQVQDSVPEVIYAVV